MSLKRIIYISDSLLHVARAQAEISVLVEQARSRNLRQCISGSLLFSGRNFAQLLEGAESDVSDVMNSILADTRHENIKIIEETSPNERIFPAWGLGYSGPSLYVSKVIHEAALDASSGRRAGLQNLQKMMIEFTGDRP